MLGDYLDWKGDYLKIISWELEEKVKEWWELEGKLMMRGFGEYGDLLGSNVL